MYKVLFQFGAVLLVLASLAWLALHLNGVTNPPAKELTALFVFGSILMLPELLYQLRQLFSSCSTLDE